MIFLCGSVQSKFILADCPSEFTKGEEAYYQNWHSKQDSKLVQVRKYDIHLSPQVVALKTKIRKSQASPIDTV